MTSPTPETGAVTTTGGAVTTPPRVPKLAAALQPSVPTRELAQSIESLASELTEDLELRLEGDASTQVATAMSEIDLSDTKSILFFGTKAQQQLTSISDMMLEEVRTKDIGPAGDALNGMVQKLRELDFEDIDPRDKPNWLERLFGLKNQVLKYIDEYEGVRDQIDRITTDLEVHKTRLLTDITKLDKLYDANLDYFRTLEVYIAAGRAKLKELDDKIIPAMAKTVEGSDDVIQAQNLRDLRSARDDLERRVHDLLLTRQVTMQSLPSIRLVQENDKSLVNKINSTIANTVPLWRQQLAQAITIFRAGQAAESVEAASNLTNELLRQNAKNLREVNAEVRAQMERGVFDIDTVRLANEELIATIEDSLRIADEGKRKRAEAEKQLIECEGRLRETLAAASARAQAPAGAQGAPAAR
jgi:uncharacterized protein YaaN involved in tellurite resistance